MTIYLLLLYILSFLFLIPEKVPESPLPILVIVDFYAFIIFIIKVSHVHEESEIQTSTIDEILSAKTFYAVYLLHLLLTSIFCIIPQIGLAIAFTLNMILFISGPFFFKHPEFSCLGQFDLAGKLCCGLIHKSAMGTEMWQM